MLMPGATYYFNKNMSTYVDYKINLLDDNQFTRDAGINTDNIVAWVRFTSSNSIYRTKRACGPFFHCFQRTKTFFWCTLATVRMRIITYGNKLYRAALLAAALFFVGCDQKPQPAKTHATEVTVLEGKTMGTFWRASIPGIDAKRSAELKEKIQTQLDADDQLLSTYKKDSALMRFNDSQSLTPWPVSEAMADIVTTSLRIGAKTDGAMDITVGPLVNLWGFGPEQQPVQIPSQEQIDAVKAKTGLQHLTVINQYHQQYLQKDPDLYVDLSTVGERLCGGSPHA